MSVASIYLEHFEPTPVNQTVRNWMAEYPEGGILALVAEKNVADIMALQEIANEASCPLIGAVFPEIIYANELSKTGILLLHFTQMPDHCITPVNSDAENLEKYSAAIAAKLRIDPQNEQQSLFMIFDGMTPNVSSFIDTLYLETGDSIQYMGVNCGSETFQPIDCLFDNHSITGDAVLCMLFTNHPGAVIEHGYSRPETTISATATSGNRISSIDWRPAFEVYRELAKTHYGVEINQENFYEHAVHFPFGIMRMDGEMLVRIPVALEDDGSIYCVGEVPENAMLTLLKAVPPGSNETINLISHRLGSAENENMLTFYCAGRRMHLGDAALDELKNLSTLLHNRSLLGALSLGEIGGSLQGGYPLFHNAAIVNMPWK